MNPTFSCIALLTVSNVFMNIAWYLHLKQLGDRPWIVAALVSWGIALVEYLFQVPANRIGHQRMSVEQLKVLQEVLSLTVFVPVAWVVLRERLSWDYLWASLCLVAAAWFMFRSKA
ncbi:MAG: DMT family protein [Planctomycetota bacterium]